LDTEALALSGNARRGFTRANFHSIDQPFPGGDDHRGERGRLLHQEIRGLHRQKIRVDSDILRERSRQAADTTGHAVDFITGPEVGHVGAHRCDGASEVNSEDRRQRMAGMLRCAGMDLGIELIDAAGDEAHQYLAPPGAGRPW